MLIASHLSRLFPQVKVFNVVYCHFMLFNTKLYSEEHMGETYQWVNLLWLMPLQHVITMERQCEILCHCGYHSVSLSHSPLMWRSLAEIQISLPLLPPAPSINSQSPHVYWSDSYNSRLSSSAGGGPPKQVALGSGLSGLERMTSFPPFPSFSLWAQHCELRWDKQEDLSSFSEKWRGHWNQELRFQKGKGQEPRQVLIYTFYFWH